MYILHVKAHELCFVEWGVQLHSFLTSALDRGQCSVSCLRHFYTHGNLSSIHRTVASVDILEKRKISCYCWKTNHDTSVSSPQSMALLSFRLSSTSSRQLRSEFYNVSGENTSSWQRLSSIADRGITLSYGQGVTMRV